MGAHHVQPCGSVYRIVQWLDTHRDAFTISRITLRTGVKLRTYGPTTADDPRVLAKVWPALDELLSAEEREALLQVLRDPPPPSVRRGSHE